MTAPPMLEWCDSGSLHRRASELIEPALTILDVGCGIRPQELVIPEFLICVEPHLEYVEILKRNLAGANALIMPLDAQRALAGLPDRCVDSVFLIDVIEHMVKGVGLDVLRECERVARKQVVLFTPLGFMPQEVHPGEVDGWNLDGGEWQEHKSGWYPEDFPDWHVIACRHLHTIDHKGRPMDPPYGGMYAIRSIPRHDNCFNSIYARDVLQSATSSLPALEAMFPNFVERVIDREAARSELNCSVQASRRATELFVQLGNAQDAESVLAQAEQEKTGLYLREAREFDARIRAFALQFSSANAREAELASRETELASRETELASREAELASREAELASPEAELASPEAALREAEARLAVREAELRNAEAAIVARIDRYNGLLLVRLWHALARKGDFK